MKSIATGLFAALTAAVAFAGPTPVGAEETLLFATTSPRMSATNRGVFHPWAKQVNEAGKGVVKIDVRDGTTLANKSNFYSRVVGDAVQISFGTQKLVSGKFPRSEVTTLPGGADDGAVGSVAFWRLYKSGLLDAEYNEIVPLYLAQLGQQTLHFAKPLAAPDKIEGLKITTTGRVDSEAVKMLGGVPLSLFPPQLYEALQRGTADGCAFPWAGFQPFKLLEVTAYHVEYGFGASPSMVFTSKKRWAQLSDAARKILMDNSGETWSRNYGANTEKTQERQRNLARKSGKHQIVKLPPDVAAAWDKKLDPVIAEWVKDTPDGRKVLDKFHELVRQVKSGT